MRDVVTRPGGPVNGQNREYAATDPMRIAVLASGAGTTLQAVIDACETGQLRGRVVAVIGNNSGTGTERRAETHSIPFVHLSGHTHPEPGALDKAIRDTLQQHEPDLILLAGYMKKLGPATLGTFAGRVINTHPSLLPRHGGQGMYGHRVHAAVLAAGEPVTGISVHLVDEGYDTGRVLDRFEVAVDPSDDVDALAARVQSHEKPFLIDVLRRIAEGDITL